MKKLLLITTSREPSRRTRSFAKDLNLAIPYSRRLNRGKATYGELASRASSLGAYGVLVVLEKRGNPSALLFTKPEGLELRKAFLLKLGGVTLLREIPGSQTPLGLSELALAVKTIPEGVPELLAPYLIECFRPSLVERAEGELVELKILGGSTGATVAFICATTDRECGPRFVVVNVFDYLKHSRIP
ncbi:MAG: hypothetical protein RMH84_02420 [Sulfolobales archaeon]|nr:hypothetical protein [Sulfolobales archaeon]MCX8208409.1 hypothetical protein [Sulfolobales archaeon]MDW8010432.1 hypothetical protein [Sulfolobales archaeon]